MSRWLVASVLLLSANIAVAQTPTPAPNADCDALCQVNKALKAADESGKPTVGSRAGNSVSIQQKKIGPIVPGGLVDTK